MHTDSRITESVRVYAETRFMSDFDVFMDTCKSIGLPIVANVAQEFDYGRIGDWLWHQYMLREVIRYERGT